MVSAFERKMKIVHEFDRLRKTVKNPAGWKFRITTHSSALDMFRVHLSELSVSREIRCCSSIHFASGCNFWEFEIEFSFASISKCV